jgi:hypothetical protein
MANRIDAPVDPVQPAVAHAMGHRALAESQCTKLSKRHDPVLAPG